MMNAREEYVIFNSCSIDRCTVRLSHAWLYGSQFIIKAMLNINETKICHRCCNVLEQYSNYILPIKNLTV